MQHILMHSNVTNTYRKPKSQISLVKEGRFPTQRTSGCFTSYGDAHPSAKNIVPNCDILAHKSGECLASKRIEARLDRDVVISATDLIVLYHHVPANLKQIE